MITSTDLAPFDLLADLTPDQQAEVARLSFVAEFAPGRAIIVEGQRADRFWLIRSGQVELRIHRPGTGDVVVQTLARGDAIGWSWLVPPHRWRFDAVAATAVEAIEVDGRAVRELAERDCAVGYAIALRLLATLADRLHGTRARLADVYGGPQ